MARIKVKRTNEWNNRVRQIGVYIDNQKIGTILNGETKEFDVPSGQHIVKAKIDWCGSRNLTIQTNDNEVKTVTISGFKFGNYITPSFAGLIALFFILKIVFNIQFGRIFLLIAMTLLLLITYYLTVGRNSYLQINES